MAVEVQVPGAINSKVLARWPRNVSGPCLLPLYIFHHIRVCVRMCVCWGESMIRSSNICAHCHTPV